MNELLLKWRELLGLTQREFAEKTGYSQKTLNDWENNKTKPNTSSLRRVAEALGIDYQDFLSGPEAYEEQRKAKGAAKVQPTPYVDLSRFHDMYLLSQIGRDLDRSRHLGFRPLAKKDRNASQFIFVVVNQENPILPQNSVHCVALDKPIFEGDIVLVWDNGGAYFVKWEEGLKKEDFDKVYGPRVEE